MNTEQGSRPFFTEHQSVVKNMCITEYDEAETMEMFKEEGRVNTEKERKRAEAAEKQAEKA